MSGAGRSVLLALPDENAAWRAAWRAEAAECALRERVRDGRMVGAVYLSGPVTGMEGGNAEAFAAAADAVAERTGRRGLVFVPTEAVKPGAPHDAAMRICLRALVGGARFEGMSVPFECLALLPGWQRSRGARVEYAVARAIGIPVVAIDGLLRALDMGARR